MPRRRSRSKSHVKPKLSVIVKAGANLDELEATLLCLEQFHHSEVLVYVPSENGEPSSPELLGLLKHYHVKKPFSPTTKSEEWQLLNKLARQAKGEVIIFLDTAFFPSAHLENTLAFKLSSPFVVGGTLVSGALNSSFVSSIWEYLQRFTSHFLGFMSGQEILFVKKAVFMKLGGFRPFPLRRAYAAFLERLKQEGTIIHIKTVFAARFNALKEIALRWPLYLWQFLKQGIPATV